MSTKEHWRRDMPQFFNFLALERTPLRTAPDALGGHAGAVVSGDLASGSVTYLVELPVGWVHQADGRDASLELFILRGFVSSEGTVIGPGGYIHVPQGGGGSELRSEAGALALVFWEPNPAQLSTAVHAEPCAALPRDPLRDDAARPRVARPAPQVAAPT